MLDFLADVTVAAVVLTVVATLLLFTIHQGRQRQRSRNLVLAVAVVALAAFVGVWVLRGSLGEACLIAVLLAGSLACWARMARDWAARGVIAWALSVDVGLLYLTYVLVWTASAHLGWWSVLISSVLWMLEVFVFVLGLGYVWEVVDVVARRSWADLSLPAGVGAVRPFVSLHVPTHNEPPDMVIETLERMQELDYDNYEILLVDNNTMDPQLWRPLEEYCSTRPRVGFIHLENWPGYKSGALNYALKERTDPRAEVIGIVDADYHVDPDFLTDNAPRFADPAVSFVQTPQDYRDADVSSYFRRLYYSYGYFFDVSQKSRNERNGAIFGGTMGLIRRSALESVGGWDEWCITEDAELSLRLLKAGGTGVHVDRSYGHGVMPLSFESLKRQRFRWCFGGVQILRLHWKSLLPGRRTPQNQLTVSQRWAYLVGGLQWFGDLAAVAFTLFLGAGAIDVILGGGLVVRRLSGLLLVSAVALVILGGVRSIALLRRSSGARWKDALGAFGLWLALGLTVARASWLGLVSREGTFLRTPKVKGEPKASDAIRGNVPETLLAMLCVMVGVIAVVSGGASGIALGFLLLIQGMGFALAPINSYAAIRSDLTDEQRRRRGAMLSWEGPGRVGGAALLLTGAAIAGVVLLASPVGAPGAPRLGEPFGSARVTRTEPVPSATVSRGPSSTTTSVSGSGAASGAPGARGPGAVASSSSSTVVTPSPSVASNPGATVTATAKPTAIPTATTPGGTRTTGQPTSRPTASSTKATSHPTGRP